MARLWSSGAELNSSADYVEVTTVANESLTVSSSTKRAGGYSWRANPSAGQTAACVVFSLAGINNVYTRAYVNIATLPASQITILRLDSATDTALVSLRLNSDGTLEIWDNVENTQRGVDSDALDTGTWYKIDVWYNGQYSIAGFLIDGDEITSGDAPNASDIAKYYFGATGVNNSANIFFDDLAINDANGTKQNTTPTDGKIVHMQPDSAGDTNTAHAGTYADIDEVTPDEGATYVEFDTSGQLIDVNLESSTNAGIPTGSSITLVQVGHRSYDALSAYGYKLRIKSQASGTVLESSQILLDGTSATWSTNDYDNIAYQLTSYVDPQAAGNWTMALLDTTQIGVEGDSVPVGSTGTTTIWALVEYVDAVPSASLSPSISPSVSPSISPSISPSASISPSVSPSVSPSASISPSKSPSISPSVSPSPSAGWQGYTKGNYANLPGNDDDLESAYSEQNYTDVELKNSVYVDQTAAGIYAIHQFKNFVSENACSLLAWLKSELAPASSIVKLQIYNRDTTAWDDVDSDNATLADTDFSLSGDIPSLTNYKSAQGIISCRIWQQGV